MQQKENGRRGHFPWKKVGLSNPFKKKKRSGLKSSISSSSALVASSESEEEEEGWKKKVRMELMPNDYTVQICSLKTTTMKNGFDAKMSKVGTHCCCDMSEKGL
jgi:hypothetical protein